MKQTINLPREEYGKTILGFKENFYLFIYFLLLRLGDKERRKLIRQEESTELLPEASFF